MAAITAIARRLKSEVTGRHIGDQLRCRDAFQADVAIAVTPICQVRAPKKRHCSTSRPIAADPSAISNRTDLHPLLGAINAAAVLQMAQLLLQFKSTPFRSSVNLSLPCRQFDCSRAEHNAHGFCHNGCLALHCMPSHPPVSYAHAGQVLLRVPLPCIRCSLSRIIVQPAAHWPGKPPGRCIKGVSSACMAAEGDVCSSPEAVERQEVSRMFSVDAPVRPLSYPRLPYVRT